MNSSNLTAVLAALAVVPLYFTMPPQPASEKWQYCSLIANRVEILDMMQIKIIDGPAGMEDHNYEINGNPKDGYSASAPGSPDQTKKFKNEAYAVQHLLEVRAATIAAMGNAGWEPFHVTHDLPLNNTVTELGGGTIHFRRRVN